MLNPERAKEMLRSMQSPDWLKRRVKRADSLRPDLRLSALAIMGLDAKCKPLGGNGRWSEFGVRSSEFGVRSSEFGVRSSEFGVRSSEFGVRSEELNKAQAEAVERLDEAGDAVGRGGRMEVFLVLCPTIAPHVEQGWQLLTSESSSESSGSAYYVYSEVRPIMCTPTSPLPVGLRAQGLPGAR